MNNGKAIAEVLYAELVTRRAEFDEVSLGILMCTINPVTQSFVRIKERAAARLNVTITKREIPTTFTTEEAIAAVRGLASISDGIIVQLPLPETMDSDAVRNSIPKEKDVDVLSDEASSLFEAGTWQQIPPVPAAMRYILEYHNISAKGKRVIVVGQGRLVGKPAAALYKHMGADVVALVKGDDVASATRGADVIILGTGVAGILTTEMVKKGVVVLDAGASELSGKVVGDSEPDVAEKASLFTPVPGGIGPVAIAEIYMNLFTLKKTYGMK